jgi:hypothetical protein
VIGYGNMKLSLKADLSNYIARTHEEKLRKRKWGERVL